MKEYWSDKGVIYLEKEELLQLDITRVSYIQALKKTLDIAADDYEELQAELAKCKPYVLSVMAREVDNNTLKERIVELQAENETLRGKIESLRKQRGAKPTHNKEFNSQND